MTANVIGGTFTAPQGVRTLTSIGTVSCVTDTVVPVAVRVTRGPFSSGICSAAPRKLEDMRDSNPTPIDVRADPESRNTRAMNVLGEAPLHIYGDELANAHELASHSPFSVCELYALIVLSVGGEKHPRCRLTPQLTVLWWV